MRKARCFCALLLCAALCVTAVLPCALADRMYLIPDSNTRYLKASELWDWNYEALGYIMNELFARHGYDFIPGEKYDNYFRCMPWYRPNNSNDDNQTCYKQLTRLEWDNVNLVKDVRAEMVAMGTRNPNGQSVWKYFSTGFDTLQGFAYLTMKDGQRLNVYSAPSTRSWRGANGKAMVNTGGAVYAAGWENGWLLVMYETNNGSVRVGYVDGSQISGRSSGATWNTQLQFDYAPAVVLERCTLTDDPARQNAAITVLNSGTRVTYLTTYFNYSAWDYIETTVDGQTVRGFIPAGYLE